MGTIEELEKIFPIKIRVHGSVVIMIDPDPEDKILTYLITNKKEVHRCVFLETALEIFNDLLKKDDSKMEELETVSEAEESE